MRKRDQNSHCATARRSDTHKVRGLREQTRFSRGAACTINNERRKLATNMLSLVLKALFFFCRDVQGILRLLRRMSPRHPKYCTCQEKWAMFQIKIDDRVHQFCAQNMASESISCRPTTDACQHLNLSKMPGLPMRKCPMSCACHKNNGPDIKETHRAALATKTWRERQKYEHGTVVKQNLFFQRSGDHFLRACAIEMHMTWVSQLLYC